MGKSETREKQMKEIYMKVSHIQTIGGGRGEGWENGCKR